MIVYSITLWILILFISRGYIESAELVSEEEYSLVQDDKQEVCKCSETSSRILLCQGPTNCDSLSFTQNQKTALYLEIKSTRIDILRAKYLNDFYSVETMKIEDNYNLITIESGCFLHMNNLKNLSISSNNNLSYLPKDVFKGLYNLTVLYLKKNNFTEFGNFIPALSPLYLPHLVKLVLNENSLPRIDSDSFIDMEGSSLSILYLISCHIEYIHPKSFSSLRSLLSLYLGQNPLNSTTLTKFVNQIFLDRLPLRSLNLYDVGLKGRIPTELLRAARLTNITHLSLAHNNIQSLKPGSFPIMPKLTYLDLREIVVIDFPINVLNQTVVPNLQILLVGGNKLSGVVPGILLPQLSSLDLSLNSGANNLYFEVGEESFINMNKLTHLNLSFNNIQEITPKTFKGLQNLNRMLSLKNSSIVNIQPGSFSDLTSLKFLNLEDNLFPLYMNITSDVFQGLQSLQVLLLGGCQISYLEPGVFSHLSSLEFLGLDRNMLVTLSPTLFNPLPYLLGLDLTKNHIVSWDENDDVLFSNNSHLQAVFLPTNKITHISPVMFESFANLEIVDLNNNPLICDCRYFNAGLIWLELHNDSYDNLQGSCQNVDFNGFNIKDFLNTTVCPLPANIDNNFVTWLGISLSIIIVVIILVSVVLACKYRPYIRYWIYLMHENKRQSALKKKKTASEVHSYSNYRYDAFVSYSHSDRNFVVRLVAMLENYEPFLTLCVYERDFEMGAMIPESILESVGMSRKIVLVITDSFVRSQWCMWELQLINNHGLFLNDKRNDDIDDFLILVKLGPVPESHLTPLLRYLLRTRVYLEWDPDPQKQRQFWDKLRTALSPPTVSISNNSVQ